MEIYLDQVMKAILVLERLYADVAYSADKTFLEFTLLECLR
jgi:hypothetical protein